MLKHPNPLSSRTFEDILQKLRTLCRRFYMWKHLRSSEILEAVSSAVGRWSDTPQENIGCFEQTRLLGLLQAYAIQGFG